jgi:ribosomal protein S18 acetylase RimI-like enzyme
MPVIEATDSGLRGYGHLVDDPELCPVEIVRWPSTGTRPVDEDTGDEAGTTQGVFVSDWQGDILYGKNEAVSGHYILAYATDPPQARDDHHREPSRMLLWHANYHPDGGQLFFPLDCKPFYVPLALPGDDITPERFVCFRFAGDKGLYIHPGIWHEGVFTASGRQRFFDKQGAVHARVSVDFAREFNCLLEAPLSAGCDDHGIPDAAAQGKGQHLNIRPKSANNRDLRPLTAADACEFQRLRLQGLQESPSSFGSSHEEEAHKTPDQVQQHIAGSVERVFLGMFTGTELVGMVGVGREQGLKERHIAFIRSMYVAPQARGQGAGQQLLAAALQQAWSWQGVEQVTLSVTASNEAAVRLYKAAGFMEVGRMPRALKMGPNYFDELMMVHRAARS